MVKAVIIIGIVLVVAVVLVIVLSICRVAGEADRASEKYYTEHSEQEKQNVSEEK